MKKTYRGYLSPSPDCVRYDIDWRCGTCGSEDVCILELNKSQIYDGSPSSRDFISNWKCNSCGNTLSGRDMKTIKSSYVRLTPLTYPRTMRLPIYERFIAMLEECGLYIDDIEFNEPRGLKDQRSIVWKLGRTSLPHVEPLHEFRFQLERQNRNVEFPFFDPDDGGVDAEILFLFEKPGPMAAGLEGGSGLISRDNDDPTAEATFRFMIQAGIPRGKTVSWNVVPGWNGTRKITRAELRDGLAKIQALTELLPKLKTVVLVGNKAHLAESAVARFKVIKSAHPSPIVRATNPILWNSIPEVWREAAE